MRPSDSFSILLLGHGVHVAAAQPVGQRHQVGGEGAELVHGLVVAVGGHGDEVGFGADVDAGDVGWVICGAGPREGGLATLGAEVGQVRLRRAMACSRMRMEPSTGSGTSSLSLSQTGCRKAGFTASQELTTFDDAAHDHANLRAMRTIAAPVFPGATFHRATMRPFAQSVLRNDLRAGRADYSANPTLRGRYRAYFPVLRSSSSLA